MSSCPSDCQWPLRTQTVAVAPLNNCFSSPIPLAIVRPRHPYFVPENPVTPCSTSVKDAPLTSAHTFTPIPRGDFAVRSWPHPPGCGTWPVRSQVTCLFDWCSRVGVLLIGLEVTKCPAALIHLCAASLGKVPKTCWFLRIGYFANRWGSKSLSIRYALLFEPVLGLTTATSTTYYHRSTAYQLIQ